MTNSIEVKVPDIGDFDGIPVIEILVAVGDTVAIPPGMPHCVNNTGDQPLKILCACSPPYSHDDTFLLGP